MRPRSYSRRLQRIVSDFGADHAFGQVGPKLKEHYGIDIAGESARQITERHAEQAKVYLDKLPPVAEGKARIVSETDGSMIPIRSAGVDEVTESEGKPDGVCGDQRKHKVLHYREYRLSLAHEVGAKTLYYAGTLGDVESAGKAMRRSVEQVGFDAHSKVHAVGDGAPWIAEQVDAQFGAQGHYLVDLYHVCDYLAAAARTCQAADPSGWVNEQKARLKRNQWQRVLAELLPHIESPDTADDQSPVRSCYRYLRNRTDQLDYQGAEEAGLPLGSGEIESAHRYIVQNRMKIAGAWWKEENADAMIALRICRANGLWNSYWKQIA